jgi:PAS domain S-box-containing protein
MPRMLFCVGLPSEMDSPGRTLPPVTEAFEHAPCGLLTTTVQGTIIRVNATFCRWLGYDADELLENRRIQDLLTIGGKVFHQTHWAPLLQIQRSVAEVKMDFVHKTGKPVPMLINASRLRRDSTEMDEFAVLVVVDRHQYERELLGARQQAEVSLDEKRAAEAALQEADRRKDEFIATLAHELRNPLAPMRTVLDLLRLKEFEDPQVIWARDVLERQMTHMSSLVDGLLDVSRINEGKIALDKRRLSLASAMEHAAEALQPSIVASSHIFLVELPDEPILLDADSTRLSQIIQNLLNNSSKYTPPGGTIWLRGKRDGNEAVISVRDTGIGIAKEHLPSLFEIFSQLTPGLQRAQGGLGIGLSLVRALTGLHGGTVSASSAGEGLGSEFVVRLPLSADQRPLEMPDRAPRVTGTKPHRILVIDDNEDAAISLAMLLDAEAHVTRTALDGKTGLQIAEDFLADVIILDIGLPDLDGYEIARLIRGRPWGRDTVLIALTGWGQEKDKQRAEAAGFDFHFTKPVDLGRLLVVLNENVP